VRIDDQFVLDALEQAGLCRPQALLDAVQQAALDQALADGRAALRQHQGVPETAPLPSVRIPMLHVI